MGKAFKADVHSPVEKLLFSLFNKHLFSSSGVPGSKYSTITAIAVITTAVFNSTQPPVYDVPSIMLSPLQTQSHLTLTTVQ